MTEDIRNAPRPTSPVPPDRSAADRAASGGLEFIYFKSSSIHGLGAFARRPILPGTQVIEYVGQKITKEESNRRCGLNNEYIFSLDDDFDLDGNMGWNPAKFINHSCTPNCEAEWIDGRIWIIATRPIAEHEEIAFNYGYDLEDYRKHPCRCGSPGCVGYMVAEDFFGDLRK